MYCRQGELTNKVQLTERIVRIVRELGMEPANPSEASQIMGLPRTDLIPVAFGLRSAELLS